MSSCGVKLLSVGQNINQQAQRSNCTGTKNDSHGSYHGCKLDCYMVHVLFQKMFSYIFYFSNMQYTHWILKWSSNHLESMVCVSELFLAVFVVSICFRLTTCCLLQTLKLANRWTWNVQCRQTKKSKCSELTASIFKCLHEPLEKCSSFSR